MKVISQWFLWVCLLPASEGLKSSIGRAVHAQCYVSGNAEFGIAIPERSKCLPQENGGLLRVICVFLEKVGPCRRAPPYGGVLAGTRTVGAVPPARN